MKRIKDGWEMYEDSKNIGIINRKKKVEFDIVINTPTGALFLSYLGRNTEKSEDKAPVNADDNESG